MKRVFILIILIILILLMGCRIVDIEDSVDEPTISTIPDYR